MLAAFGYKLGHVTTGNSLDHTPKDDEVIHNSVLNSSICQLIFPDFKNKLDDARKRRISERYGGSGCILGCGDAAQTFSCSEGYYGYCGW